MSIQEDDTEELKTPTKSIEKLAQVLERQKSDFIYKSPSKNSQTE